MSRQFQQSQGRTMPPGQYSQRPQQRPQYGRPPQQQVAPPKELAMVEFETMNGKVTLTPEIIKAYLVSGDTSLVTDQEVMMFLTLCKYRQLNPFLREAYLIKFGNAPASIVVSKDLFTKRAAASKLCEGWQAGVIVLCESGEIMHRDGTLVVKDLGERLIGGWARVFRKEWKNTMEVLVSLEEYRRYKKSGEVMDNWVKMPGTMIRKVALVQALREALPEEFGGMYSAEEMDVDESEINKAPVIDIDPDPKVPAVVKRQPAAGTYAPPAGPQNVEQGNNTTEQTTESQAAAGEPRRALDQDTITLLEEFYNKITDYAATKEHHEATFKAAAENVICEFLRIDNISQAVSGLLKGALKSMPTVLQRAEELYQEWMAQDPTANETPAE